MIKSFADRATAEIYDGVDSKAARKIDKRVWLDVTRKSDVLNAAISLNDLKSPGNHLERLKGDWIDHWSIRVNDRYRIIFRFENGNALDVRCTDIH